jgi:hypothetical protein
MVHTWSRVRSDPKTNPNGKKEADRRAEKENDGIEAGTGFVGCHDKSQNKYLRTEQHHHTQGKGGREGLVKRGEVHIDERS